MTRTRMRARSFVVVVAGAAMATASCGGTVSVDGGSRADRAGSPGDAPNGASGAPGGDVASSSSSSSSGAATTAFDPRRPASAPAVTASPPCGVDATAQSFASAPEVASALEAVWDACDAHPLCPSTDPHLLIGRPSGRAVCGRWCGGDGGHCATADPRFVFDYAVLASNDGAWVLDLASAVGDSRFTVRVWGGPSGAALELTRVATREVTTLEAVGVPVK